jgi:anti-anti-sigma factor
MKPPAEDNLYRGAIVGLQISIRKYDDVTILDLTGRVVAAVETALLSVELQKLVAQGACKMLLNLTAVTQMDSSSISVIAKTYASLRRQGGSLKLVRPRGHVLEVLNALHLLEMIPSFEDETQALASFRPQGYFAKP